MPFIPLSEAHEHIAQMFNLSNLNMSDFAARYDLHRVTMSNIVHGNTEPSRALLKRMGFEIGIDVPAKS